MDTQKTMHDAICSTCNSACQVPFMPKPNSKITCKTCWAKGQNAQNAQNSQGIAPLPDKVTTEHLRMSIKDKQITALSLTRAIAASNANMTSEMIWSSWLHFKEKLEAL